MATWEGQCFLVAAGLQLIKNESHSFISLNQLIDIPPAGPGAPPGGTKGNLGSDDRL